MVNPCQPWKVIYFMLEANVNMIMAGQPTPPNVPPPEIRPY